MILDASDELKIQTKIVSEAVKQEDWALKHACERPRQINRNFIDVAKIILIRDAIKIWNLET